MKASLAFVIFFFIVSTVAAMKFGRHISSLIENVVDFPEVLPYDDGKSIFNDDNDEETAKDHRHHHHHQSNKLFSFFNAEAVLKELEQMLDEGEITKTKPNDDQIWTKFLRQNGNFPRDLQFPGQ